ncbi:MAG TPA: VOC family protein [Sphingomicrobium sp.]|nr:VOC family protein [Sphingomicrobium sp.]
MLQKVAFTMYPVKDMPRARAFYEDVLALGPGSGGPASPWVEFDLPGGGCLAITTVSESEPSARAGGTIAFEVDDLPSTIADLKAKGVTFSADDIESPVCRMAIAEDPDGNAIILHKLKSAEERGS